MAAASSAVTGAECVARHWVSMPSNDRSPFTFQPTVAVSTHSTSATQPAFLQTGQGVVTIARRAQAIVTMNVRDFAGASANYGLRILKPGELVAELRKEDK